MTDAIDVTREGHIDFEGGDIVTGVRVDVDIAVVGSDGAIIIHVIAGGNPDHEAFAVGTGLTIAEAYRLGQALMDAASAADHALRRVLPRTDLLN